MNKTAESNKERVIKIVQELLLDEVENVEATPALITEKMERVLKMNPKWAEGLDRTEVIDELIRRFSMWIGQDAKLSNDEGHVPWLNAARKKDWRYWQRYSGWLEGKLSWRAVDGLDSSTDSILGSLEDPLREGVWDRRGLVVGHVQSGKTGSYTGLICKAADAGYKIIIVLAGLHNNLRAQTQIRLDEGFLGYETPTEGDSLHFVGVGRGGIDANIKPNCATNRLENGDFTTQVAKKLAISPEQRPWLFVVKKNKTVLERLLKWIGHHVVDGKDQETGRKIVTRLPLLIIDDEADHASVDTGEQTFDADGKPDEEHQPKTINRLIRRILHSFTRSAYVGYTATPFANIFIHERGATLEEGPDLFPSAFIINLAAPSNYIGPAKVFGQKAGDERDDGLPLIRLIDDHASHDEKNGWMPTRHPNGYLPLYNGSDELPPSLREATEAFLLACAVRTLRGQSDEHSSMLVHVTRFNSVQGHVHRQVDEHVRHLRQRLSRGIGHEEIISRLEKLWNEDFVPSSAAILNDYPDLGPDALPAWEAVVPVLPEVVSDIEVRMINGTAKDSLDYAAREGTGLKVIAIGGDKLARGLTLEGLCVSYFLRATKMYDTLMQMGRWFGYRPGYLDLCRLYTTSDLIEWFGHITDASEELREEFELMMASGLTPREYGLKVQSHPVLMVTSRLKMRTAKSLMLSFSGQLVETVSLFTEGDILEKNLAATKKLIAGLDTPETNPERMRDSGRQSWTGYLWEGVPAEDIIDFLRSYRTHKDAYKVNSDLLGEFIESMRAQGELAGWTVALVGGGKGNVCQLADGISVDMIQRSAQGEREGRYSIGRLLSPRDEAIDLDAAAWSAALEKTREAWHRDAGRRRGEHPPDVPNGPAIRAVRGFGSPAHGVEPHPERALLLLYVLDPREEWTKIKGMDCPVVAFGISFPGSNSGQKVEYMITNVAWEREYGPAE